MKRYILRLSLLITFSLFSLFLVIDANATSCGDESCAGEHSLQHYDYIYDKHMCGYCGAVFLYEYKTSFWNTDSICHWKDWITYYNCCYDPTEYGLAFLPVPENGKAGDFSPRLDVLKPHGVAVEAAIGLPVLTPVERPKHPPEPSSFENFKLEGNKADACHPPSGDVVPHELSPRELTLPRLLMRLPSIFHHERQHQRPRTDVWLNGWDLWYYGTPKPKFDLPEDLKERIENEVGVKV